MFNGLDRTYSLVNVVAEQLTMLLDAGIPTKLLVSQDCPDTQRFGVFSNDKLEWVKIINRYQDKQITWHDYTQGTGTVHENFLAEADVIAENLISVLSDVDVCILHDIHYQGWHLIHNVALRKARESLPNLRCIAFTHSAPVNRPPRVEWPFSARFTPIPRTIYVYPTQAGISALARQYAVPEGRCRVINNSLDLFADLGEDVKAIARQIDLITPDILIVYPGRLTTGKQFEKLAAFAGAFSGKLERGVQVICCDFPSMDIEPSRYKLQIRNTGKQFGLAENSLVFTSDLGYPLGFPRRGVLDLFTLSNLFVCPSFSESFGLTVLEAASRGNVLVLNQAVPALEELGKQLHAYFMRWDARNFGFDTKENYHPSEQAYLAENAENVLRLLRENPVAYAKTMVRMRYTPRWIWKNQLEPLLEPW